MGALLISRERRRTPCQWGLHAAEKIYAQVLLV